MHNDSFKFKQFDVSHGKCAMKVGTDGVLLGAWANAYDDMPILDVGTGSGIVALMMAQRFHVNKIIAIDIDKDAVTQAQENFNNSPWNNRLYAIQDDFANSRLVEKYKFGTIVANPPFFNEQVLAPDDKRCHARSVNSLPTNDLIRNMALLMLEEATASIILPYDRTNETVAEAALNGLFLARRTDVITKPGKMPKRSLLEFKKSIQQTNFSQITLNDNQNNRSNQYKNLTKDFYIH